MKKNFLLIFGIISIFLLVFSGCSINLTKKPTTGKIPQIKNGDGLIINFNLNSKWISQGKLIYSINFKNTGAKAIILKKDNFNLNTIQQINLGQSVFTKISLTKFYKNIFKNSNSLNLAPNAKISTITGILYLDNKFFSNLNNQKINYVLNIKYNYQTNLENNIQIKLLTGIASMKILTSISQSAPLKIISINLYPQSNNNYLIGFEITNSQIFSNLFWSVKLSSISFNFGKTKLINCKYFKKSNSGEFSIIKINNKRSILLNKLNTPIFYMCKLNYDFSKVTGTSGFTTQITGNLKYEFNYNIQNSFSLPSKRNLLKDNFN